LLSICWCVGFKDVDIDKKNDDSVNHYAITTQGLKKKIIIIKFCDIVRVSIKYNQWVD